MYPLLNDILVDLRVTSPPLLASIFGTLGVVGHRRLTTVLSLADVSKDGVVFFVKAAGTEATPHFVGCFWRALWRGRIVRADAAWPRGSGPNKRRRSEFPMCFAYSPKLVLQPGSMASQRSVGPFSKLSVGHFNKRSQNMLLQFVKGSQKVLQRVPARFFHVHLCLALQPCSPFVFRPFLSVFLAISSDF